MVEAGGSEALSPGVEDLSVVDWDVVWPPDSDCSEGTVVNSGFDDVSPAIGMDVLRKGAVETVIPPVLPDGEVVVLSVVLESLSPNGDDVG